MMAALLSFSSRAAVRPLNLPVGALPAPPILRPKLGKGPLKVLQSGRAPAQLSLFDRPYGGR
jgi:hypothetical protein